MKSNQLVLSLLAAASLLVSTGSQAESLVDGTYQSAGDENGKGKCTLILQSLEESHKYGDQVFELESSGEGACEWSAMGMSKSFAITAGLVSNSGSAAFVKVNFPFGPAGGQLEITTYDLDGSVRNSESFSRIDEKRLTGG